MTGVLGAFLYQGRGHLLCEVQGCGSMNRVCPVFLYGHGPAPAGGRRVHAHVLRELWLTSAACRKRGLYLNVPKKELIQAASINQSEPV